MSPKDSLYQQLRSHLAYLKLTAAAEALPAALEHAHSADQTHTEFLEQLLALEGEELFEELGVGLVGAVGVLERGGQCLGRGGELEVGQMGSQLLIEAVFGAHEASGWVRRR